MLYVTADTHWGHHNIIGYSSRPFATVEEMNSTMVELWNATVTDEDTVFFLGDFSLTGAKHLRVSEDELNGKIVRVKGSHDGSRAVIQSMVVNYYGMKIGMVHKPQDQLEGMDLNLHGHVHGAWKHRWVGKSLEHVQVNVGVDVWEYRPVSLESVVKYARRTIKHQDSYTKRFAHNLTNREEHHG